MNEEDLVIIGLDPGGTTGICSLIVSMETLQSGSLQFLDIKLKWGQIVGSENGQILGEGGIADITDFYVARYVYVVFCIESFILRQKRKDPSLLAPVRVIAKIDMMNNMDWKLPIVYQQPSLGKSAMPDARLKAWNAYAKGMPHARDATRHAITLARRFAQKPIFLDKVLARTHR